MSPAHEFENLLGSLDPEVRQLAMQNFAAAAGNGSGVYQDSAFRESAMWICISAAEKAVERMREAPVPPKQTKPTSAGQKGSELRLVRYSQIPRKRVEWLWRGYIPFGKQVMLEGDPDVGKSTFTVDIAARVTTGARMPDGTPGCEPAGVLILSAEDDPEDTIGPRLMAAGADMEEVYYARFTLAGEERELTICEADIDLIEEMVRLHCIKLVVIDPMAAYLDGNVRVYVDHDVRRALRPLKGLAERTGCAVLVVRHWTKAPNPNAQHRGGGSVGITAAARGVLSIGFDPEDENQDQNERKRVLAVAKLNVGAKGPPLEFHLEYVLEHEACRVKWGGISKHTANSLSAGPALHKGFGELENAKKFLLERLTREWTPAAPIQGEAKAEDIAGITLRRAREELGITQENETIRKTEDEWLWRLPGEGDQIRADDHLPMNGGGEGDQLRVKGHLPGLGDAAEPGVES